jgi:hypothetical protein
MTVPNDPSPYTNPNINSTTPDPYGQSPNQAAAHVPSGGLPPEFMQQLGEFIDSRIRQNVPAAPPEQTAEEKAETARQQQRLKAGVPDVDPEAGPDYYVHLANGDVITTKDSGSTHVGVDGETVAVIGRYLVHPKTGE